MACHQRSKRLPRCGRGPIFSHRACGPARSIAESRNQRFHLDTLKVAKIVPHPCLSVRGPVGRPLLWSSKGLRGPDVGPPGPDLGGLGPALGGGVISTYVTCRFSTVWKVFSAISNSWTSAHWIGQSIWSYQQHNFEQLQPPKIFLNYCIWRKVFGSESFKFALKEPNSSLMFWINEVFF